MLLKGSQGLRNWSEIVNLTECDQKYQCKERSSWILGCPVVERNQVFAENNSFLLLWSRQLHNCIIFFHFLLQDGEGQK